VAQPKQTANESPNGEADTDNGQLNGAEDAETTESAAPAAPKAVAKKGSSAKEVIPFKWKLVGDAQGMILTLFKAVEREEVESQLERIQREGYYANLRILDADYEIKQSAAAKSALMRAREREPKTPKKTAKGRAKPARALKAEKVEPASKPAKATARARTSKPTKARKATETAKAAKIAKAEKTHKTKAAAKTARSTKPKAAAKTKKKQVTSTKTRKKRTAKKK